MKIITLFYGTTVLEEWFEHIDNFFVLVSQNLTTRIRKDIKNSRRMQRSAIGHMERTLKQNLIYIILMPFCSINCIYQMALIYKSIYYVLRVKHLSNNFLVSWFAWKFIDDFNKTQNNPPMQQMSSTWCS